MKILNLVNQERGHIKYKISKFPDGQQNITILSVPYEFRKSTHIQALIGVQDSVQIKSRLNNWLDLELIIATVACLKELGIKEIHLFVPYFIGARSDRKFEEGGNWYLKQVICPIINTLQFDSIIVLDAHSSVLGNLLNNYKAVDNKELVDFALKNITKLSEQNNQNYEENGFILVSPDAGAAHKINKLAENIGYKRDIIICSKERDTEGKLTKTVVFIHDDENTNKDFIIVDDICDGGRTFINIAKEIKNYYGHEDFNGYQPKIYLVITHGIFSAGFKELSQYFDGIFCTNSYKDVGDYAGNEQEKTNTVQLNVF